MILHSYTLSYTTRDYVFSELMCLGLQLFSKLSKLWTLWK